MNGIEKRARELLATQYEGSKYRAYAAEIRNGQGQWEEEVRAVVAALTPPEGYVLVPARPTKSMMDAAVPRNAQDQTGRRQRAVWAAMLAARPGVP